MTTMLCFLPCAGSMLTKSSVKWTKGIYAAKSDGSRTHCTRSRFVAAQTKQRRTRLPFRPPYPATEGCCDLVKGQVRKAQRLGRAGRNHGGRTCSTRIAGFYHLRNDASRSILAEHEPWQQDPRPLPAARPSSSRQEASSRFVDDSAKFVGEFGEAYRGHDRPVVLHLCHAFLEGVQTTGQLTLGIFANIRQPSFLQVQPTLQGRPRLSMSTASVLRRLMNDSTSAGGPAR